jgi:hypothetical protein
MPEKKSCYLRCAHAPEGAPVALDLHAVVSAAAGTRVAAHGGRAAPPSEHPAPRALSRGHDERGLLFFHKAKLR